MIDVDHRHRCPLNSLLELEKRLFFISRNRLLFLYFTKIRHWVIESEKRKVRINKSILKWPLSWPKKVQVELIYLIYRYHQQPKQLLQELTNSISLSKIPSKRSTSDFRFLEFWPIRMSDGSKSHHLEYIRNITN